MSESTGSERKKANTARPFWLKFLASVSLFLLTTFEFFFAISTVYFLMMGVLTAAASCSLFSILLLAPIAAVSIWLFNDSNEHCKRAYHNLPHSFWLDVLALILIILLSGIAPFFIVLGIITACVMLWPAAVLFALTSILIIPTIIFIARWRFNDCEGSCKIESHDWIKKPTSLKATTQFGEKTNQIKNNLGQKASSCINKIDDDEAEAGKGKNNDPSL